MRLEVEIEDSKKTIVPKAKYVRVPVKWEVGREIVICLVAKKEG